jgi:cytochrome o ubiquinol oxidase subunit 3
LARPPKKPAPTSAASRPKTPRAPRARKALAAAALPAPVFYELDEHEHPEGWSTMLGFWIYLMSDSLIFAMLFATFGVLGGNYAAGPSPKDVFELPLIVVNTSFLLLSSITFGFAMLATQRKSVRETQLWLVVTAIFGLGFLAIELYEFAHLIGEGAGPQRSAFLSSFFTLVGTHGLHVTFGLVWITTMIVQVGRKGLIPANLRRLMCLSMFWHFLDVIWIGVFTVVYLLGMLR